MTRILLAATAIILLGADERQTAPRESQAWFIPATTAARYKNIPHPQNGEGSCVQASMSYCGCQMGQAAAECLLRSDPKYGPPELGGSYPGRTAEYCQRRRIPIANIEGAATQAWIEWALLSGRSVAITYGYAHMIAAVGITTDRQTFFIWDNNFPTVIRAVPRETFIKEHRSFGGGWCVVVLNQKPVPWVRPEVVPWWGDDGGTNDIPSWNSWPTDGKRVSVRGTCGRYMMTMNGDYALWITTKEFGRVDVWMPGALDSKGRESTRCHGSLQEGRGIRIDGFSDGHCSMWATEAWID